MEHLLDRCFAEPGSVENQFALKANASDFCFRRQAIFARLNKFCCIIDDHSEGARDGCEGGGVRIALFF